MRCKANSIILAELREGGDSVGGETAGMGKGEEVTCRGQNSGRGTTNSSVTATTPRQRLKNPLRSERNYIGTRSGKNSWLGKGCAKRETQIHAVPRARSRGS